MVRHPSLRGTPSAGRRHLRVGRLRGRFAGVAGGEGKRRLGFERLEGRCMLSVLPGGSGVDSPVSGGAAGATTEISAAFDPAGEPAVAELDSEVAVRRLGTNVTIEGTEGDDSFQLTAGVDTHTVVFNGRVYEFDSAEIESVVFSAGPGKDRATIRGTSGSQTMTMYPTSASISGDGLAVDVVETAEITVFGGGGNDVARLYDSHGNDHFVGTPSYAALYGDGFYNRARLFGQVSAYASDGLDEAKLFDSSGDDLLATSPVYGSLAGEGFSHRVWHFDGVHAYATAGGVDVARHFDSAGDDVFWADPANGALYRPGQYHNRAKGFEGVHAYATAGGNDVARLVGSDHDDRYNGNPTEGAMYVPGRYYNRGKFFEEYHADSLQGPGDLDQAAIDGFDQSQPQPVPGGTRIGGHRLLGFELINGQPTAAAPDTGNDAAPIESFTISTDVIAHGETATLRWQVGPVSSLTLDNGLGDVLPLTTDGSGSLEVAPLGYASYTLTAGGQQQSTVSVIGLPERENLHIYILIGQSNMYGNGLYFDASQDGPNPRVLRFGSRDQIQPQWTLAEHPLKDYNRIGMGLEFAQTMLAAAEEPIAIGLINHALGASPIQAWQPGASHVGPNRTYYLYDETLQRARAASAFGVVKGVLWHQGEYNSHGHSHPQAEPELYARRLHALVDNLRRDLQDPGLPLVCGKLVPPWTNQSGRTFGWDGPYRDTVENALAELPNHRPNSACVDNVGLKGNERKPIHFDAESQRELGRRYAREMLDILANSSGEDAGALSAGFDKPSA